jgi:hypothetical protein
VQVEYLGDGQFILYAAANVQPSNDDFLQVIKSVSYYNFHEEVLPGVRTIRFDSVDLNGDLSTTTSAIDVSSDMCQSQQAFDLVLVLDSSSSLGLAAWGDVKAFAINIVSLLTISEHDVRSVLVTILDKNYCQRFDLSLLTINGSSASQSRPCHLLVDGNRALWPEPIL